MNGYAPNPTSSSNDGAAPLTAGLLARKGEAMPAVDADAHAGVDITMFPTRPAAGPSRGVSQTALKSLYARGTAGGGNVRAFHPRPANANQRRTSAAADVVAMAAARRARRLNKADALQGGGPRATVTFRMPAKDFVRLRFASRDLDMTCQSIILDAIDTYLDANDVAPVSDEVCARETARLMQIMKKRRP